MLCEGHRKGLSCFCIEGLGASFPLDDCLLPAGGPGRWVLGASEDSLVHF